MSAVCFEAEADLLFNFEKSFDICANLMSVNFFQAEGDLLFHCKTTLDIINVCLVALRQKVVSCLIIGKTFGMCNLNVC